MSFWVVIDRLLSNVSSVLVSSLCCKLAKHLFSLLVLQEAFQNYLRIRLIEKIKQQLSEQDNNGEGPSAVGGSDEKFQFDPQACKFPFISLEILK